MTNLKRYEEALQNYNKALDVNPIHIDALYNKTNLSTDLQRYDWALIYIDKALTINPSNVNVMGNKAAIL